MKWIVAYDNDEQVEAETPQEAAEAWADSHDCSTGTRVFVVRADDTTLFRYRLGMAPFETEQA